MDPDFDIRFTDCPFIPNEGLSTVKSIYPYSGNRLMRVVDANIGNMI
jgi:hypothetical protein